MRKPPLLCGVPFTRVYLDAVLKSPQRSAVAVAGALDADTGASKSNRISKTEKEENLSRGNKQQQKDRHLNCHLHKLPGAVASSSPSRRRKLEFLRTEFVVTAAPFTKCTLSLQLLLQGYIVVKNHSVCILVYQLADLQHITPSKWI